MKVSDAQFRNRKESLACPAYSIDGIKKSVGARKVLLSTKFKRLSTLPSKERAASQNLEVPIREKDDKMKYCPECQNTRSPEMRLCPVCSETQPRYKVVFNSTRGVDTVYDRWLSEELSPTDIVSHLNTSFNLLSVYLKDEE